jgi:hypothetical protein
MVLGSLAHIGAIIATGLAPLIDPQVIFQKPNAANVTRPSVVKLPVFSVLRGRAVFIGNLCGKGFACVWRGHRSSSLDALTLKAWEAASSEKCLTFCLTLRTAALGSGVNGGYDMREAINIIETSPGLYCVRVSWAGQVREDIEVSRDDAWEVGVSLLADIIQATEGEA